jgi:hypothetical protein
MTSSEPAETGREDRGGHLRVMPPVSGQITPRFIGGMFTIALVCAIIIVSLIVHNTTFAYSMIAPLIICVFVVF